MANKFVYCPSVFFEIVINFFANFLLISFFNYTFTAFSKLMIKSVFKNG
jgi:hypothetical protein